MHPSNLPKPNDRIRLVHMGEDPEPVPAGSEGTVIDITELNFGDQRQQWQISVRWDNGRGLSCICPPDIVTVIEPALTC